MGRKSRTAVLKRQREVRKAEKAAMKREKRVTRDSEETGGQQVATTEDLAGYGFDEDEAGKDAKPEPPREATRDPGPAPHPRYARGVDLRDRLQRVQPMLSGGRIG